MRKHLVLVVLFCAGAFAQTQQTPAPVNSSAGIGVGPRVAFLVGAGYYLIGALLLRPVDPRRREEPGAASDMPAEEAEIRAG